MFWLARHAGRRRVEALLQRKLSPSWRKRLTRLEGREGFLLLVVLRLIPAVPYNLINYAFGLTEMSWGSYMLASCIGIIPGTFAFINIGDKALDVTSPDFWIALGLLALLLVVTALLGKVIFRKKRNEDRSGEKEMKIKNNLSRLGILLAAAVLLTVYLAVPAVNVFVNNAVAVLGSANLDRVAGYIRSFGGYAMAVSFCLMVVSSILAPLPAPMITLSNAAIFGWWQGAILSWPGAWAAMWWRSSPERVPLPAWRAILKNSAARRSWSAACCPLFPSTLSAILPV